MAVVDLQRLMSDSDVAVDINKQVEDRRERYLDELSAEEQQLYETDRQLAGQRQLLSPDAYAEKRRSFEAEVQEEQRASQERRRQLESARTVAMNKVRDAILRIVSDLADTRGFNLVLPTSAVVMFAPSIDLTSEVLEHLNRELPSVEVVEEAD